MSSAAAQRVKFDTSPLPGWRMQSYATVCELVCRQQVAARLIAYAIFHKQAVFQHFGIANSA
jgi:hypothetical protein